MSEPKLIRAEDFERQAFALKAAAAFNEDTRMRSFSVSGNPKHGELFALKWGCSDTTTYSVMVFELPYDATIFGDLDQVKP